MAAPILTTASIVTCPHGAPIAATGVASRVLIGGVPVLTIAVTAVVQGCPLQPPVQSCASVTWETCASRVFADGKPVVLQSSSGMCLSHAGQPAGPAMAMDVQTRVVGN